jgi:hypothetical protein
MMSLNCGHQRYMSMESHGGMTDRRKPKNSERKTCRRAALSTANPTWTRRVRPSRWQVGGKAPEPGNQPFADKRDEQKAYVVSTYVARILRVGKWPPTPALTAAIHVPFHIELLLDSLSIATTPSGTSLNNTLALSSGLAKFRARNFQG